MSREHVVHAVNELTEALRLLEYHLSNNAANTAILRHYIPVTRAMKHLDHAMETAFPG